jgi:uncharacterized protein YdhG (YjbR/CyaY superfamily)
MARTDFTSVDDYISTHPAEMQTVLRRVRGAIRAAMPDAEETISYHIPAFRLHGGPAIYFAAWKNHYSLYPATPGSVAALKTDLARYIRNKTIRFPLAEPVPVALIKRIAAMRAKEVGALAAAKKPAAKKPAAKKPPR